MNYNRFICIYQFSHIHLWFLLALFLLPQAVKAQSPSIQLKTLARFDNHVISSVKLTRNKTSIIVAGCYNGNKKLKAWLSIYNRKGEKIWSQSYFEGRRTAFSDAVQLRNGQILAVGIEYKNGKEYGLVVALDKKDHIVHEQTFYTGPRFEHDRYNNEFVLAFAEQNSYLIANPHQLSKYNNSHQLQWTLPFQGYDYGFKLRQRTLATNKLSHAAGGYYTAITSALNPTIIRIDPNGNIRFTETIEDLLKDDRDLKFHPRHFASLLDNEMLVTGSKGNKGWIRKIDSEGHQIWDKTFSKTTRTRNGGDGLLVTAYKTGYLLYAYLAGEHVVYWIDQDGNQVYKEKIQLKDRFISIIQVYSNSLIAVTDNGIHKLFINTNHFQKADKPKPKTSITKRKYQDPCEKMTYRVYKTKKVDGERNVYTLFIECKKNGVVDNFNHISEVRGAGGSYIYGADLYSTEREAALASCGCKN